MNENLLLFLIPIILAGSHLFGIHYNLKARKYVETVHSFAAGLSIAYVFLILLPEINLINEGLDINPMLYALIGFAFFHFIIKIIFKNAEKKDRKLFLDETHLFIIGVYNFLISFVLVELAIEDLKKGLLILGIIAVHSTLSELADHDMHIKKIYTLKSSVIWVTSVLGALLPIFEIANPTLTLALFSFSAGAIIYISIREELPMQKEGRPAFFILGVFSLVLVSLVAGL